MDTPLLVKDTLENLFFKYSTSVNVLRYSPPLLLVFDSSVSLVCVTDQCVIFSLPVLGSLLVQSPHPLALGPSPHRNNQSL